MREYLREDLRDLKPYQPGEQTYRVKMDANESPYDIPLEIRAALASELLSGSDFHHYPDSDADALRMALTSHLQVEKENLMIGTGSDELIQVLTNAFVEKGDVVLCPTPSFSMYAIFARIAGGVPVEYPLGNQYAYDLLTIHRAIHQHRPKILYLCTPNNPTGNSLAVTDTLTLLERFDGIVVVDEAYFEFCGETMLPYIHQYPNLIVLRTFSKAMGLAGLRVGYLVCSRELAAQLYKVKPPYNVNTFSQRAAALVLEHAGIRESRVEEIINSREWLYEALKGLRGVTPYPSSANFILMEVNDGQKVYQGLLDKGILVRHYIGHPLLNNYLRVTIGSMEDNMLFLKSLAEIVGNLEGR